MSVEQADPTPTMPTMPKLLDHQALIEAAQSLEPLPASVGRLAALVSDDRAELSEIVEVITFDQALTGSLLRQANSAASSSRHPIGTVQEAVVRLGTATVLSLAVSSCVGPRMGVAVPAYQMVEGELWRHSVASAIAAEIIRSRASVPIPGEAITAALMHDIGKLVLCTFLGPEVLAILDLARSMEHLPRSQAEVAVLEVHHGELGALIVQQWGLPQTIIDGVAYHHTPEANGASVCYAVHLAEIIAHDLLDAPTDEDAVPEHAVADRDVSLHQLGIDPARYADLLDAARIRFEELAGRYLS